MKISSTKDKKFVYETSYVKEKDVNDMILAGKTKEEVEKIILTNSFSDLEASLKLKDWRKI